MFISQTLQWLDYYSMSNTKVSFLDVSVSFLGIEKNGSDSFFRVGLSLLNLNVTFLKFCSLMKKKIDHN